jgi:hypothetical protein
MLNSATHSLLSQSIHISLLPQTFQDAIHITSSLGLKHIWIDSLYIVQDSKGDWEQESSMIDMVYSRALCNIAATASSSSDQGCFRQRDVSLVQPTIVDSCWTNHENYQLRVIEALNIDEQCSQSPLTASSLGSSRAFPFPQVPLFFGSQQLLWDCRQMFASEAYPQGLPPGMSLPALPKTFEGYVTVGPDIKRPEKIDYLWCDLVQHYSRCVLTLEKDKFVAISGIVKEMLKWQNDAYLAGLWWYQLPSQLLWKAERPEKLSESPPNLISSTIMVLSKSQPLGQFASQISCPDRPEEIVAKLLHAEKTSFIEILQENSNLASSGYAVC